MQAKKTVFHNYPFWGGLIIICSFLFIFGQSALSTIYHATPHFDDAYNATVSANLMRHGEYRVSFPDHILFHNKITTGVPMLLPLAYIYQWFGISTFTTEIQAVFYGLLVIIFIWLLLSWALNGFTRHAYLLAAFLTLMVPLSSQILYICSVNLMGEIASLCYILISVLCWYKYFQQFRSAYILWSGALIAISFLTKSAMIFFVVSWLGIVLIETFITKQLPHKGAMLWGIGFVLGFILVDSYKCYQLGSIGEYLRWWVAEWRNMMEQSDGYYHPSLLTKFNYLEEEFSCNKFLAFFMVLLAPVPYCYCLYKNKIKKQSVSIGLKSISIGGITGDSLLVYSFLFGNSGLMHAKRLIVNTVFVKVLFVFFLGLLLLSAVRAFRKYRMETNPHSLIISIVSVVCFLTLIGLYFPVESLKSNLRLYSKVTTEDEKTQVRMVQLLDEIRQIPSDIPIYTDSWFQEPCVSLFLDRDMISYKEVSEGRLKLNPEGYFLVGYSHLVRTKKQIEEELQAKLIPADTIWVEDYQIQTGFLDPNREDFVQMTKYRIIPYDITNN